MLAAAVLSLNLCTDQYLLMLAPERAAAVSFLARDAALSTVAGVAPQVPAISADSELVLALKPDLVLAGDYGAGPALRLLAARGIRIERFGQAEDWASIDTQISAIAAVLGVPDRGAAARATLTRRLAALPPPPAQRPLAVSWGPGGFVAGRGTLTDTILTTAGYRNLAAESGIVGYGTLPLETLVAAAPDLLLITPGPADRPSLAEALLTHPAVSRHGRVLSLDGALTSCGGSWSVAAAEMLARVRLEGDKHGE